MGHYASAQGKGHNGGFNPFCDAHSRFADHSAAATRSAVFGKPLPGKTEWEKGGVRVEFTGGRAPGYRVMHGDKVVKEIKATAKWRQDWPRPSSSPRTTPRIITRPP